jgi:hypothetical protein
MYNDEPNLMTEEELAQEAEKILRRARKDGMNKLANTLTTKLKKRISNRAAKQEEWLESSHLYYGSMYSSLEYKETPFAGTAARKARPDFNIVRTKCDAAIAQCIDMQFAIGEKNWDLWPAANNTDPANSIKCQMMSDEIEAQLDTCRYAFHSREAIRDRVILGTGILKGPVNTGTVTTVYTQDQYSGEWMSKSQVVYKPAIERVDPWFFFPDDTVADPDKIGDAIQVHPMSAYDLVAYVNHEGYEREEIEEALKEDPEAYMSESFVEYKRLVDANPALFKNKYCVIEYHGPIKKCDLDTIGIRPAYETPLEDYFGEVWIVNNRIIRIELENIEGSFETPYAIAPWKKDPGSVFGFAHPLTMKDQQRVVTQTWHMILDNASISSGPQAAIQQRYITPADGEWEMGPRKVWYLTDPMMKVSDAIQFFDVPNVLQYLTPVLAMAREFSEEESGTNALAAGLQSTQVGASATGDMLAQKNSTVLLDAASEEWDDHITAKVIRRMYGWNMQYSQRKEIKGNYNLDVRSANEYKNKQIHVRDLEKLSVETAGNPHLAKWINQDVLTNTRLALMAIPARDLIRSKEEADAWEKQQQEQAAKSDPNAIKAQVEMAKLDLEKQRLQIETQQMQMEMQLTKMKLEMEAQVVQMKEQVALANNQAMAMSAQASTLKAQLDYQAKMAKVEVDAQAAGMTMQADTMKFDVDKQIEVAAMQQENAIKNAELEIYKEEIKLKKQGKTGI